MASSSNCSLDRPESQHLLISMSNTFTEASQDPPILPPAGGSVQGLLKLVHNPGTQEGLILLSLIGACLSDSMRELHRHGV